MSLFPPGPEAHCPQRRSEATLPSLHFLLGQFQGLGFVRAKSGQSLFRGVLQGAHQLALSDTKTEVLTSGGETKASPFPIGAFGSCQKLPPTGACSSSREHQAPASRARPSNMEVASLDTAGLTGHPPRV